MQYIDIVKIAKENKEFKLIIDNVIYECKVYVNAITIVNNNFVKLFNMEGNRWELAKNFTKLFTNTKAVVQINDYKFKLDNRELRRRNGTRNRTKI